MYDRGIDWPFYWTVCLTLLFFFATGGIIGLVDRSCEDGDRMIYTYCGNLRVAL